MFVGQRVAHVRRQGAGRATTEQCHLLDGPGHSVTCGDIEGVERASGRIVSDDRGRSNDPGARIVGVQVASDDDAVDVPVAVEVDGGCACAIDLPARRGGEDACNCRPIVRGRVPKPDQQTALVPFCEQGPVRPGQPPYMDAIARWDVQNKVCRVGQACAAPLRRADNLGGAHGADQGGGLVSERVVVLQVTNDGCRAPDGGARAR